MSQMDGFTAFESCEMGSFEANPESLLKKLSFNHRGG